MNEYHSAINISKSRSEAYKNLKKTLSKIKLGPYSEHIIQRVQKADFDKYGQGIGITILQIVSGLLLVGGLSLVFTRLLCHVEAVSLSKVLNKVMLSTGGGMIAVGLVGLKIGSTLTKRFSNRIFTLSDKDNLYKLFKEQVQHIKDEWCISERMNRNVYQHHHLIPNGIYTKPYKQLMNALNMAW